jgi:hypothetical protein
MRIGGPAKRKVYLLLLAAGFLIAATTERTVYTNTSNKELKPRVMRLVNDIRQLVYTYKKKTANYLPHLIKGTERTPVRKKEKGLEINGLKIPTRHTMPRCVSTKKNIGRTRYC